MPVEVPHELLEPQHHGVVNAADVRTLQNRAARGGCCGDGGQPVTRGPGGGTQPWPEAWGTVRPSELHPPAGRGRAGAAGSPTAAESSSFLQKTNRPPFLP